MDACLTAISRDKKIRWRASLATHSMHSETRRVESHPRRSSSPPISLSSWGWPLLFLQLLLSIYPELSIADDVPYRELVLIAMASLSSATITAPSLAAPARRAAVASRRSSSFTVRASFGKAAGTAAVAVAASALLAGGALAQEVLLGADDGGLVFKPSEFTVKAGDTITFKNNAGFPHNVVFDEDEVPSGVDAAKISMSEEDLLNAPGETYSVTLTAPGTYSFYCSPHQGAGMVGKVTVN